MNDILSAALEYAEHGFAVIPVNKKKEPLTVHGLSDCSTDENVIRGWWEDYPNANVAIVTGRASEDLLVVDIDIKPDENKRGDLSLKEWEAQHGDFPNTVMSITGSGGRHYFFRANNLDLYKNKVDAIPAVDIRGDGAYVVAPPSRYADGRRYRWFNDISVLDDEIADANDSVMELLELNRKDAYLNKPVEGREHTDVSNVTAGHRNDVLFSYACTQRGQNVPFDIAMAASLALNDTFSPPLARYEVERTVKSAYKYQPNEKNIYTPKEEPITEDDLQMMTVDQFEEQDVEWLIKGYLPKGQITMMCGTGGTGKTSVWVSLIAALSAGRLTILDGLKEDGSEPDVHRDPMKIMFFSSEDTVENVIRKRLREENAMMQNILTIGLGDPRMDRIKFGSDYLHQLVAYHRPALVVFDPLQAFIDKTVKMSDRNSMRQTMRSLIEWGKEYETTFLIVMHTNKQLNVWGRTRMADSADLWDIARCVWMVGDVNTDGLKYLSHEKSNYGETSRTMLFQNVQGHPSFYGWSDLKDRDYVLASSRERKSSRGASEVDAAENCIMSILDENPDGLLTGDLRKICDEAGIKKWAVDEAKTNLKKRKEIDYFKDGMSGSWSIKKHNI